MSTPAFDLPPGLGALTPYHVGIATNDLEASMMALTAHPVGPVLSGHVAGTGTRGRLRPPHPFA
jgi:hypothetical protein